MKLRPSGYALFEVVLAVTIFAVGVLKLVDGLVMTMETATNLNQKNAIRIGLRTFIEEARRKEVGDMATESRDERLDATYSSTVEELSLKNRDGKILNDLYVLHAKATWGEGDNAQEEKVDLFVYKPQVDPTTATGTDADSATAASKTQNAAAGAGPGAAPQGGAGASGREGGGRGGNNALPGGQGGQKGGGAAGGAPAPGGGGRGGR